MARKINHKIRIATRSGAVAVSYAAYLRVQNMLVKCNTVWAARKGAYEAMFDTLLEYALEAPGEFSEAAQGWLGVLDVQQPLAA